MVAYREPAIEMFSDDDAGLGITAAVRPWQDLEQVRPELDGVVVGDDALVGEAADIVEDLLRSERSIRDVRIGRGVSKACIVAGEETRQDRVGLFEGAGTRAPQFADKPAVEGAPQAFDAAFGLRRRGGDPADAELLQGAAELRWRAVEAAQLLGEGGRMAGIAMEDTVPVAIDRDRTPGLLHYCAQNREVARGVFFVPKERGRHFAGGIVDSATEGKAWSPAFQPVVMAGIELDQQAFLGHTFAAAAMTSGPPWTRTGEASGDQPAVDGPVGRRPSMVFAQGLGEVLVIEAGIGGPGQAQHPLLKSAGKAIVRGPSAIAVGQGTRAVAAKGGQQAAGVTHREAQHPSRVRRSQSTLPNLA